MIDPQACPFCHSINNCMVQSADDCWCTVVTVPEKLIELVPAKYKAKTCICRNCINDYHADAASFVANHSTALDVGE